MKYWIPLFALLGLVVLAGCQTAQTPAPAATAAPTAVAAAATTAPAAAAPTTASGVQLPVPPKPTLAPVTFKVKGDGTAVATVNGVAIKLSEYERTATQVRDSFVAEGLDPNSAAGKVQLSQIYDEILDTLIAQELVRQGAKAQNITVTDGDVKAEMDRIVVQQGGEDKLQAALATQGMTRDDLLTLIRDRLLAAKLADALTKDMKATGEQVHARHILVQTEDEAKKVIDRIKAGEDFGAVAKELSQDPGGKTNGGDLGWIARGQTVASFEDAAFALALKTLSAPVKSQFGYHVIEVLEKDPNRPLPDEQMQQAREEKLSTWLDDQKKAAKIEQLLVKE